MKSSDRCIIQGIKTQTKENDFDKVFEKEKTEDTDEYDEPPRTGKG
jgi:hypothetical protein